MTSGITYAEYRVSAGFTKFKTFGNIFDHIGFNLIPMYVR